MLSLAENVITVKFGLAGERVCTFTQSLVRHSGIMSLTVSVLRALGSVMRVVSHGRSTLSKRSSICSSKLRLKLDTPIRSH